MRIVTVFNTGGEDPTIIKLDTYLEEGQQTSFEIGGSTGTSTVTLSAVPEKTSPTDIFQP